MDRHLDVALLSALADGELDLSTTRNAREHLAHCEACSAQLASFTRLDTALAAPAEVGCAGARPLRSALLDTELSPAEAAVAVAHLSSCASCAGEQAAWTGVERTLRALPAAMPSAAVDARIARLTAPAGRRRFTLPGPSGLSGLALRGAVTVAVVVAILVGLLPGAPSAPEQAQQAPTEAQAVVAGVQQAVLYAPTNTLYVLQTDAGAVDAVDAATYAVRTRIAVGGRPTALALSEATSRVIVLDAAQRSLTEIDAQSNAVVATTEIPVTGTPTSVRVEQSSGRIIVAAIPDQPIGGPAPTPTLGTQPSAGVVAVLDGATKKLETIASVDVAPRVVVTDASGKLTLLVSSGASTLVDGSYKKVKTLPGGVAAAFAPQSGVIAVLSADSGSAVLSFNGDGAPGPLRLTGVPLAVTAVPSVGFAVLLGSGSGNGRIVVVDEAGRAIGVTDVDQVGRDLAFDASSQKFTVVGGGKVSSAPAPAGVLPQAIAAPPKSAPPAGVVPPVTIPPASTSPAPSASPSASPSTSPVAQASPATSIVPVASTPPIVVPPGATPIGEGAYRVSLGSRVPLLVAAGLEKVWFIDQNNWLSSLDTASGNVLTFDSFPKDAQITALTVAGNGVYAADFAKGRLYVLSFATERITSRPVPFITAPAAMTAGPDGRIWIGLSASPEILIYDPVRDRTELLPSGVSAVRDLAFDGAGQLWFTDGGRAIGRYQPRGGHLDLFAMPGTGTAQHVLPDRSGRIWVGSSTGELSVIEDGVSHIALNVRRPITALAADRLGNVWFLGPAANGPRAFVYGRADGSELISIPGPATSLTFNSAGRAWLADPTGGFYLELPR